MTPVLFRKGLGRLLFSLLALSLLLTPLVGVGDNAAASIPEEEGDPAVEAPKK